MTIFWAYRKDTHYSTKNWSTPLDESPKVSELKAWVESEIVRTRYVIYLLFKKFRFFYPEKCMELIPWE